MTSGNATPPRSVLFEARSIAKSFGDVHANRDISLDVAMGEKLALLGENGAGKSTFVKMIDGVLRPDRGEFLWRGKPVSISSPAVARQLGIGMVFQHFSTFEALTVGENLALALPKLSKRAIGKKAAELSDKYGLTLRLSRRVEALSAGEKQRVEIVRALIQTPKLLILDEPTSVLTPQEADRLFETLDALAADGMALIYISHRLPEIRQLCDRATILRQGAVVATCDPKTTPLSQIAEMMIGKTADPIRRTGSYVGAARLKVDNLSISVPEGTSLKKISFNARRGEILAIAGVAGEGQEALFSALSGEIPARRAKSITLSDKPIGAMGPTRRRRLGIAFAPEQRLGHAAVGDFPLSENLRITRHGLRGGETSLKARAAKIREAFDVRAGAGDPKAATLSGGNLQKFVMGREIDREPEVFVVAQPTWGVDAGAASFIRNELMRMTEKGAAVVVISQDLEEIFQIADRVAVLHRGELSETFAIDALTPERIGLLMSGSDIADLEMVDNTPEPRPQPKLVASNDAASVPPASASAVLSEPVRTVETETASAPPSTPAPPKPPPPQAPTRLSTRGTTSVQWTPPESFHPVRPEQ